MPKTIIGVMGPGDGASSQDREWAYELGKFIADEGWVLVTGGRNAGVMDAASKGASDHSGLTIGILPDENAEDASAYVDIPICTGMGSARNNINVLTADVIIACGMGPGTLSEIALALKAGKPVVTLNISHFMIKLLCEVSGHQLFDAMSPAEAIKRVEKLL